MIVKAKLILYKGTDKRKTSIKDRYRPILSINGNNHSGRIRLINKTEVFPREECIVEIEFLVNILLDRKQVFYFFESK